MSRKSSARQSGQTVPWALMADTRHAARVVEVKSLASTESMRFQQVVLTKPWRVQSTDAENSALERTFLSLLLLVPVLSPTRITPKTTEKSGRTRTWRTLSRGQLAEWVGLALNLLLWMPLGLQGTSDRLDL
jgi:hypothetical protein